MLASKWRPIILTVTCCLALAVGALLLQAQTGISDFWVRFPDGTIQTTAAHNCFDPTNPEDEMVRVGGVCIDKYEASLWDAPVGGNLITGLIPCQENGFSCTNIFARSVSGVLPRADITWFQAQAALANVGKRLPTNAEWQMAVRDHGTAFCNTTGPSALPTPTHANCRSDTTGTYDMVGNLWEWVADWVPAPTDCPGWGSFDAGDFMCLSGASTTVTAPGSNPRGGHWDSGSGAGPFALIAGTPTSSGAVIGFRGAR